MNEINGNASGSSLAVYIWQSRRHLQESLPPDEVGLELGAKRIPLPGRAWYFAPTFTYQGVVEHDGQGLIVRQAINDGLPGRSKQGVLVDAFFGEESISRRPVYELLGAGAKHPGNGMPPQGHERTDDQPSSSLENAFLLKGRPGLGEELFEFPDYS